MREILRKKKFGRGGGGEGCRSIDNGLDVSCTIPTTTQGQSVREGRGPRQGATKRDRDREERRAGGLE